MNHDSPIPASELNERAPGCLSRLQLECVAFAAESAAEATHLANCAACAERVAKLRSARTDFLAQRPPAEFMKRVLASAEPLAQSAAPVRPLVQAREARRVALALSLCAAAVALLAFVPGIFSAAREANVVRMRGKTGAELALYVSRDGAAAVPLAADQPLYAGDVLRFGLRSEHAGYVTILNLDDRGHVTPYVQGQHVQAGEALLKGSIRLDDFIGEELLVLVLTPETPDVTQLTRALVLAHAESHADLRNMNLASFPGDLSMRIIRKQAR
jgi:hypothetical protein